MFMFSRFSSLFIELIIVTVTSQTLTVSLQQEVTNKVKIVAFVISSEAAVGSH